MIITLRASLKSDTESRKLLVSFFNNRAISMGQNLHKILINRWYYLMLCNFSFAFFWHPKIPSTSSSKMYSYFQANLYNRKGILNMINYLFVHDDIQKIKIVYPLGIEWFYWFFHSYDLNTYLKNISD